MKFTDITFIPLIGIVIILIVTIFASSELQTIITFTDDVIEINIINLRILNNIDSQIDHLKINWIDVHNFNKVTDKDFKKWSKNIDDITTKLVQIVVSQNSFDKKTLEHLQIIIEKLQNQRSLLNNAIQENDSEKILSIISNIDDLMHGLHIIVESELKHREMKFGTLHEYIQIKSAYAHQLLVLVIIISTILSLMIIIWAYKTVWLQDKDVNKTKFASMITHELKTPLTPIITACEMLNLQILGSLNDSQKEEIQRIDRNATYLLKIITDILDVQKLEMEEFTHTNLEFDVSELFDELASDYKEEMSQKNINLVVDVKKILL